MNKKQLIILWIIVIFIGILIGLKTTTVYPTSEIIKPGGPEFGHTALMLYGSLILTSENAGGLHFLLNFGEYKYQLIIAVIIIGCTLIYSWKSKKINS